MADFFSAQQRDKLQSRLRVFANGDSRVNAIRAEHIGALRVKSPKALRDLAVERQRDVESSARSFEQAPREAREVAVPNQKELPPDIEANVFVTLDDASARLALLRGAPRRGRTVTARIALSDLPALLKEDSVLSVEIAESIHPPLPLEGDAEAEGPAEPERPASREASGHANGEGVLVGIVDVGGFDFSHPDFLVDGKTRFAAIWDQGGSERPAPPGEAARRYGSELLGVQLDAAIADAPAVGVAPTELEPQSQMSPGSHATHVASIAAGNHSRLSQATLAGVLVSLPAEDQDRRLSFSDTTRIAHAVEYLIDLQKRLEKKALVINISLGTNGGPHDGSEPMSRWLDASLTQPGRAICVAAGNSGQERPLFDGDIGFVSGRIHTEGRIEAAELLQDLEWTVVGNGIADISENELEIWYSAGDRFEVALRPPGSDAWLRTVGPGEYFENAVLSDRTVVSVYNDLYDPANGDNKISVYLSPFFSPEGIIGVAAGNWTVRLIGKEVRDGRYHGWIERDDPRRRQRGPDRELWNFPSFFHGDSNVDRSSVSSLACGPRVVGVANLDEARQRINASSSQGPTRDGRSKPDVAAPGTDILAANGFFPEKPWVRKSGTSMASPFVAGVVGLMLDANPGLTAAQVGGIIQRTARPLPGANYQWRDDAGYGQIQPAACVGEAARAHVRTEVEPTEGGQP